MKRLVVDASVAFSAGGSVQEESSRCREFLEAVIANLHSIVMTPEIEKEWKNYDKLGSRHALKWLRRFYAVKQVDWHQADEIVNDKLRQKVGQFASSDNKRTAMLEDIHLIEAALVTEHNVVSKDNVRRFFTEIAVQVPEIALITWVNPVTNTDCIDWLKKDCPVEKHRQLGFIPEDS